MSKSEPKPVASWAYRKSFTASTSPEARSGWTHKGDTLKSFSRNLKVSEPAQPLQRKSGSDKRKYGRRTLRQPEKQEMWNATCMRRALVSSHPYQQTQKLRRS